MSKSLYVKITQGQALGPYSIFYDVVQPSNYAVLYGTTTPATNIPLAALTAGSGVRVTIPDTATSVILQNANGDCLNYRDYAIVSFSNVSKVCTGYYDGTATINVTISGKSGQYQYSKDGGTTFSASTTSKTYAFTNVSNGSYTIAVKRVDDGTVSFYQSNPVVINCAPVLTASLLSTCTLTPPPNEQYLGTVIIYASGGSGNYEYALKNLQTGIFTAKQTSNSFANLNGLNGQYEAYVYDVDNTVTPNYQFNAGAITFDCPAIPPPLSLTTSIGCGPEGFIGTGTVTVTNFAGGSGVFSYLSFGSTLLEAQQNLVSTTNRIPINGATSYTWENLANQSYYIGMQDNASHTQFFQSQTVSCTIPEPPTVQFLAYNLALNSCTKTGTGVRYWTYDSGFTAGYYKINGGTTLLKLELETSIPARGTRITSFEALTCLSSYVTLTPMNDLLPSQYTLYVNGTPYTDFASGQRSYPVGSVIKVVYNSDNSVCGVTLNGDTYASGTEVTIALNIDYTFILKNYNHWIDYGTAYCQDNQTRQNIINDCGNTSYRIVSPCYTACTNTTYSETCSGTYGQNVLRTVYYACNGQATGQTSTYTCGSCSSTTQDWVPEGYFCKTGDCTKWATERQMNPCAAGYNTTRERDTDTLSCDCGETCLGTYEVSPPTCDPNNPTTAIYVTKYVCFPNSVVSSRSVSCSSACGASTVQNWVNEGATTCNSCVKQQLQRQTNPCAAAYNTTRTINLSNGATCECGEACLGTELYYFCGGTNGKTYYSVQRYKCAPYSYATTPEIVGTCLVGTCGVSKTPEYTSQGYSACYQPSCTYGPVYKDTNYCSDTYNNYFIEVSGNKINVGGQPSNAPCNTASDCRDTGSSYCSGSNLVINQYQANPCSTGSCPPRVIEYNSPSCSATVRIYGAKTSGTSGVIYYGINDPSCPLGGTVSLLTAGSLNYTVTVPLGAILYVKTYVPASESACLHCAQQTTGSYCSTYSSCLSSYTISASVDISVKAAVSTTCTP